jgi:hypothetical protein
MSARNRPVGDRVAPVASVPARAGRVALGALALVAALAAWACGSTSMTSVGPSPAKCEVSLPATSRSVAASGGNISFPVSTQPECTWSTSTQASWLAVSPASGQGAGQIDVAVAANVGPARTATITAAGQTVTVVQAEGCAYSVQPDAHAFGAAGGSGAVSVSTAAACAWTSVTKASWLAVSGNPGGVGSGGVAFDVQANAGPQRTGTLTVAGRDVSVTQASGCTYDVTPLTIAIESAGGTRNVTVSSPAGCPWQATSDDPSWIAVVDGASGTGGGVVTVFVPAYPALLGSRGGSVTVAGYTVSITQGD